MFGNKLKLLRKERHLTQDDVANMLGVTKNTVSTYERNLRQPDYTTIDKLASFFNTTTDYLIRDGDLPDDAFLKIKEKTPEQRKIDKIIQIYLRDIEWTSKDLQEIVSFLEGKKALKELSGKQSCFSNEEPDNV